jgi:glucoamylase
MADTVRNAPGWPGIEPRWTSSAKQGVGTSLNPANRVSFTVSHGILNEIYYPRVDQACTRDMGMLVAADGGFFSEEKRHTEHRVSMLAPGVPGYLLVNTCSRGRYRIEKELLADPARETLLQRTRFTALAGPPSGYRLYVLLAPHIGNRGWGNTGWVGDYKGVGMVFAERDDTCMALACSSPWLNRSVGFVGTSDGWQEVSRTGRLGETWDRAENGNIALVAEVDLEGSGGDFVVALGFGRSAAEAGNRALASLSDGFERAKRDFVEEWAQWQERLAWRPPGTGNTDLFRISTAVIRVHEAKNFPGGLIASLSIPWGYTKGDDDLGGYHLVWARDLVETAGGLLAAGGRETVRRVLHYLESTQEADGHWPQNMWLDGTPYWHGIQMDETALPVLLVDLAWREVAIDEAERARLWPMTRKAARFILSNGPVTPQDRWEEDPGYSPFTLAAEIAALLCAADMADAHGEAEAAVYLRETADAWNDGIDRWIYARDTELARAVGVEGYYVRIAPPDVAEAASPAGGFVPIKNRPPGQGMESAASIVSPDALALVRFGLRAADDPRIVNTRRVIDSLLRVETPRGPSWRRYNEDGYGEKTDGAAFDGTGIGRAWPLITGERAHYELAAGRRADAEKLCRAMEAFAGDGGLLPEQVWDADDIPARELYRGRPSGSAMPLLWAHAEYLKLRRSLADGRVFDMPPQTVKRYLVEKKHSPFTTWRPNQKCRLIPRGSTLRVELPREGIVRWSADGGQHRDAVATHPAGWDMHVADIPTGRLAAGSQVGFTITGGAGGDAPQGLEYRVVVDG